MTKWFVDSDYMDFEPESFDLKWRRPERSPSPYKCKKQLSPEQLESRKKRDPKILEK